MEVQWVYLLTRFANPRPLAGHSVHRIRELAFQLAFGINVTFSYFNYCPCCTHSYLLVSAGIV